MLSHTILGSQQLQLNVVELMAADHAFGATHDESHTFYGSQQVQLNIC